jgi:hypothetical protein
MRTYNLFRRRQEDDLICAVAEDEAVPRFIGAHWEFVGSIREPAGCPLGSSLRAGDGSRFHGFYLFESVESPSRAPSPAGAQVMGHHRPGGA